jgi:P-type E1-E2 ATPase
VTVEIGQHKDTMMRNGITISLPGHRPILIKHLIFDFNGTLANNGILMSGAAERLEELSKYAQLHVLTSDTFETARGQLDGLPLAVQIVKTGKEKAQFVTSIGARYCAVIGNGTNDMAMFKRAALSVAVVGPEGLSAPLLQKATLVVLDVVDALELFANPQKLVATLRA